MSPQTARILGQCAVSAACIVSAAILAAHGRDGWGWFVFVAILALPGVFV